MNKQNNIINFEGSYIKKKLTNDFFWDFDSICRRSGWKPEDVKTQYFLAVRKGLVVYTPRQYEWIKFYAQMAKKINAYD